MRCTLLQRWKENWNLWLLQLHQCTSSSRFPCSISSTLITWNVFSSSNFGVMLQKQSVSDWRFFTITASCKRKSPILSGKLTCIGFLLPNLKYIEEEGLTQEYDLQEEQKLLHVAATAIRSSACSVLPTLCKHRSVSVFLLTLAHSWSCARGSPSPKACGSAHLSSASSSHGWEELQLWLVAVVAGLGGVLRSNPSWRPVIQRQQRHKPALKCGSHEFV